MIVVLMFVFVLVAFDAIPEIDFSCQTCVAYNLHRTIYGGKADFRVFSFDKIVKVINREVSLGLEEYVQDLLSLFAVQHAVFFKILTEYDLF
jgi:hypothetical protein